MQKLAIIGLGLIGGSIGLALKRAKIEGLEIWGCDREWGVGTKAQKLGAIDKSAGYPAAVARDAAVVIVATPVLATRGVFEEIAPELREDALVMDTCSTKLQVCRWANELLPEPVDFVGGHPMAGKTDTGLEAADADLFRERPFVLTPEASVNERGVRVAQAIAEAMGARPVFMDAAEHDSYVAAVSHLPLVAAAALFHTARESKAWPELAALAAGGFVDTTRLASGSPEMAHDICLTNAENIAHWLDRYIAALRDFRALVAGESDKELFERFARIQIERDRFLVNPRGQREEARPELPTTGDTLAALFVGDRLAQRMKEMAKLSDEKERGRR